MRSILLFLFAVSSFIFSCINSNKGCVPASALGVYKSNDGRRITFSDGTNGYTVKLERFGLTSGEYTAVCDQGQLKCKIPFAGETVFNFNSNAVKFLNKEFRKE